MERFRQLHRHCGCLVIDNIHELATKPAAQDEMVSTMERLLSNGGAINLITDNLSLGGSINSSAGLTTIKSNDVALLQTFQKVFDLG